MHIVEFLGDSNVVYMSPFVVRVDDNAGIFDISSQLRFVAIDPHYGCLAGCRAATPKQLRENQKKDKKFNFTCFMNEFSLFSFLILYYILLFLVSN